MQKFQELLTEAAQLKQSQLKKQRKNFQSLPEYIKSGLNYSKKYRLLRNQNYMIQMHTSQKLKKEGNQLFQISHYEQSIHKYQQALGIFRYIAAKTYDNMKDEDMIYQSKKLSQNDQQFLEEYNNHLVALYLNICSCLTKTNKKEDAIHSADEALKIKETAKAYYKKAQAYLQYINKDPSDIKLGFLYLNKSYQLSKDPSIIQQMHKIKKEIDEERDKEKKWFKFMFDKNSKAPITNQEQPKLSIEPKNEKPKQKKEPQITDKKELNKLKGLKSMQQQKGDLLQRQDERLEKTKQKLSKFISYQYSQEWLQLYEGEFISKHGSKIYSILQLYGYKEYLGEYKSLLAQCLQYKKYQQQSTKRKELYAKYFQWLKNHPIDKICKYLERYDLQTKWIKQQRENRTGNKSISVIAEEKQTEKLANQLKQQSKADVPEYSDEILKQHSFSEPNPTSIQKSTTEYLEFIEQVKNAEKQNQNKKEQQQTYTSNYKPNQANIKYYSIALALILMIILRLVL